jgi:hypothetical protein
MTRRQWAHLPLVLLVLVTVPVGIVLALVTRAFGYFLRGIDYLRSVYIPSRVDEWHYIGAPGEPPFESGWGNYEGTALLIPQKCTIPPDDHGMTCDGLPCDMVQAKYGLDEYSLQSSAFQSSPPPSGSPYHEFRARTDPPPWGRGAARRCHRSGRGSTASRRPGE